MLVYPQQNAIDYLLQIGAPPPAIARGEHRFHHTNISTEGCYNLLQIGAPSHERLDGGGRYSLHQALWTILFGQDSGLHRYFNMSNSLILVHYICFS